MRTLEAIDRDIKEAEAFSKRGTATSSPAAWQRRLIRLQAERSDLRALLSPRSSDAR